MSTLLTRLSQYMPFLVSHLEQCTEKLSKDSIDKKTITKCLRYCYSLMRLFLQSSYFSAGRDHSMHLSLDRKCLSLMKVIVDSDVDSRVERSQHLDRVFVLSSLVIQRLFEPLPLPISQHNNPFVFHIPLSQECIDANDSNHCNSIRDCDGNECNLSDDNEVYGSDSDEDDENESDFDDNDTQSVATAEDKSQLVSYEQFFTEVKDFDWDLKLGIQMSDTNDNTSEAKDVFESKERKNSIDNIRSLFCGCFTNNKNNRDDTEDDTNDVTTDKNHNVNSESHDIAEQSHNTIRVNINTDKPKELFFESADWRQVYTSMANKTTAVQPITTLAEPELCGNLGNDELELLGSFNKKDPNKYARSCLLDHVKKRFDVNAEEYHIIYDCETGQNHSNGSHIKNKLQFESRFESANLRNVFQTDVTSNEYTLVLNPDVNTSSHIQWFYFRVSNTRTEVEYTFNVVNCEKQSSLYNEGQRVVIFSDKESQTCDKPFWKRTGHFIAYYRNHYVRDNSVHSVINGKNYYTLTFKLHFTHDNDVCHLSYNYPYSYSYLKSEIHFWQNCHNSTSIYFRHQTLCTSLVGNEVPIITITGAKSSHSRDGQPNRGYIVLMARVHPAESNSSWIMKGVIDFLLSDRPEANQLRQKYVFKILPMLNPDGVINGK